MFGEFAERHHVLRQHFITPLLSMVKPQSQWESDLNVFFNYPIRSSIVLVAGFTGARRFHSKLYVSEPITVRKTATFFSGFAIKGIALNVLHIHSSYQNLDQIVLLNQES